MVGQARGTGPCMPHVVSTRDTKVRPAHVPVAKQRRARKVAIPRRRIMVLARVPAAAYPGPGTGAVCVRAMPAGSYVQRAAAFTPGPGGATTSRGYTGRNIAGLQHTFLARPLERAARFNTTIFCKPGFGRVCVTWDFCFGSNPKPLFSTL